MTSAAYSFSLQRRFLLLFPFFPFYSTAFNLFIGTEEMNRTLGITARMDYVADGLVNEYSTRFPYRIAENVSQLRFTWSSPGRTARYSLRAVPEQFDVVPVLLVPADGIVPRKNQNFAVEYRCVGARSGQFQVLLHFNISLRPPLQFTLKQEKICSYKDGRRAFAGDLSGPSSPAADSEAGAAEPSILWHIGQLPLLFQLLAGSLVLLVLLCLLLLCCCHLLLAKQEKGDQPGHQFRERTFSQRQRARWGSLYAASRHSLRRSVRRLQVQRQSLRNVIRSPARSGLAARTASSVAASDRSNSVEDSAQPFIGGQQPSTSTAPLATSGNSSLLKVPSSACRRIVPERPEAQQLDISQALVELYADRNLFEQAPRPELDGQFGQLIWANWRQIGATGTGAVVDEVDDQEDDAKEDKALICKTLKPGAGRVQFERFLRNALQFHHLPPQPHLAQVVGAATFGNFMNPESVKDLPLICYAHDGFGVLKKFLQTCRGSVEEDDWTEGTGSTSGRTSNRSEQAQEQMDGRRQHEQRRTGGRAIGPKIVITSTPSASSETTLRTHDLVSLGSQIVSAVRHLHKFGIIHKDIATRNCLVSRMPMRYGPERLHVQISDSALSRDLFPEDYAVPPSQSALSPGEVVDEPRPVRWMAPELLLAMLNAAGGQRPQLEFNSGTDMWAFGVLLWELFTCGQRPYEEVDSEEELVQAISYAGLKLSQPYNCPDELYAAMSLCWCSDPSERPTAGELDAQLQEFMHRLRKYI